MAEYMKKIGCEVKVMANPTPAEVTEEFVNIEALADKLGKQDTDSEGRRGLSFFCFYSGRGIGANSSGVNMLLGGSEYCGSKGLKNPFPLE